MWALIQLFSDRGSTTNDVSVTLYETAEEVDLVLLQHLIQVYNESELNSTALARVNREFKEKGFIKVGADFYERREIELSHLSKQ